METFEPGIASAYNTHTFRRDEQGMKCLNSQCGKVMTIAEWQEKRRCFCQSINVVPAIARSAPPTRLEANPRTGVNPLNRSSNTPLRNSPTSTANLPSTSSHSSSSSRNTTPVSSSFTNSTGSSPIPGTSSSSSWGYAAIISILLVGLGWCTAQVGSFSSHYTTQTSSPQTQQPQLTPKEVITSYYKLAPSNREASLALLSDDYKSYYEKNNKGDDARSFWNTIYKVDLYSFESLTGQSPAKQKLKVWVKYTNKRNETSCESLIIELIFDQSKGQWFIDKTSDTEQKFYCEV